MHERVGPAFLTDLGGRAVAGKNGYVVAEWEQFLLDSSE